MKSSLWYRRWVSATVLFCVILLIVAALMFVSSLLDLGHNKVEEIANLHGLTVDEVISRLGNPDSCVTIEIRDADDQFRRNLFFYYPPTQKGNLEVKIKEYWWRKGNITIVVWFHEVGGAWVALTNCRFRKGLVF